MKWHVQSGAVGSPKMLLSAAQPQQSPALPELGSWGGSGTATKGWMPTICGDVGTTAWSILSLLEHGVCQS